MVARIPKPNKTSLEFISVFSGCIVKIRILSVVADFTSGSNVGRAVGLTVGVNVGIFVGRTVGFGVEGLGVLVRIGAFVAAGVIYMGREHSG